MEPLNVTPLPPPKNLGKIIKHNLLPDEGEFDREKIPLFALKNHDILNQVKELI